MRAPKRSDYSMTSGEIVRKTLEFASPPRIPRQLWYLPWAELNHPGELAEIQARFPDDLITSPPFYTIPLPTKGEEGMPGIYVDEWGCVFNNRLAGLMGEVREPLLKDWKDVRKIRIPRERLSVDVGKVNEFCHRTDKFVLSKTPVKPFEQLQLIRKPENLFLDLAELPDALFLLLERIHAFYREELELWASTNVDALVFADDWGSQHQLLISPALWRRMFKPLYKDYIEIAHKHGKYIFMHTDGFVMDIFPDFVELGLDAVNCQLFCMDIEELGRRFAGKITFWGEIDRQYLLPFGTPEEIGEAVRRVKEALFRNGGVIAQCELGVGARPENVSLVFEMWEDLGRESIASPTIK